MSASTIANRRYDLLDSLQVLRDSTAAAISATTAETGLLGNFDSLLDYKVVVQTSAYTSYTVSTAVWVVTVEASTDLAFTSPITLFTLTTDGTALTRQFPLNGQYITQLGDPGYLRVKATKTGSPGNFDYFAHLSMNIP